MNVLRHELRYNLRSALLWAASLAVVGAFILLVFPAFAADTEMLVQLLKAYPEAALKALGIEPGSINSFNGYYSFLIVYPILCASIQGLVFGLNVIGKEGARKTCDFLFTRPAARASILAQKYIAMLVLLLMGAAGYALATLAAAHLTVTDFDPRTFWLLTGSYVLTSTFCLSLGFCIGCFARRIKSPNAVAIGLSALMFALLMVENLAEEQSIAWFSPMSYLNPRYIAAHRAYDMPYLWALVALTVTLMAVGVLRYRSKDIHTA